MVLNKSRAFFEQIVVARAWNAIHGGVYVPISSTTQPNPYLKDSLRDIVTVNGMKLTKINPAFMTRQIAEINIAEHDLKFHITSLQPIRPANKPDEWETKSLELFEQGAPEVIELVNKDTVSQYRYMAPLITTVGCMKCHEVQGYKVGDVRGGISISFPAYTYTYVVKKQLLIDLIIHFVILILGLSGLFAYYRSARNYYSALKEKNADLQKTNATKDRLFSIIGHDLRAPFNIILGYSDLLKTGYEEMNEETRKKLIIKIDDASNRTFGLLRDLLLWTQSQTKKLEITQHNINVKELITEATGPYLANAEKKNISLAIDISDKLIIHADKTAIKTVIGNLFNNAIKFTPRNGNIDIIGKQKQNKIEIVISDTGVGIPAEIIQKLFIFEESKSTLGTEREKGTGLGLIICKELIEEHNGKIWVESELGCGTSFYISLPTVESSIDPLTRNLKNES